MRAQTFSLVITQSPDSSNAENSSTEIRPASNSSIQVNKMCNLLAEGTGQNKISSLAVLARLQYGKRKSKAIGNANSTYNCQSYQI